MYLPRSPDGGDDGTMERLRIRSIFKPPKSNEENDVPQILSLDFHRDGQFLVSVDSNSQLRLVDCLAGNWTKHFDLTPNKIDDSSIGGNNTMQHDQSMLFLNTGHGIKCQSLKRYGPVGICRFTHHKYAVLLTTRGNDEGNDQILTSSSSTVSLTALSSSYHDVRYYSIYDNSYLRFFRGHTDEIVSLSMCPADDHFITSSRDHTVKVWNLKSSVPVGNLVFPESASAPFAAYDPSGKEFAVMYTEQNTHFIRMYDMCNYVKGPFTSFSYSQSAVAEFLNSNCGTSDLSGSNSGNILARAAWRNLSFSSDSQYILVGRLSFFLLPRIRSHLVKKHLGIHDWRLYFINGWIRGLACARIYGYCEGKLYDSATH